MTICEISASSWFYYKEHFYDARSHERKKRLSNTYLMKSTDPLIPRFKNTGVLISPLTDLLPRCILFDD